MRPAVTIPLSLHSSTLLIVYADCQRCALSLPCRQKYWYRVPVICGYLAVQPKTNNDDINGETHVFTTVTAAAAGGGVLV